MLHRVYLALILLCSCAQPQVLRLRLMDQMHQGTLSAEQAPADLIYDLESILWMDVRITRKARGAISLELVNVESVFVGREMLGPQSVCFRVGRCEPDPYLCAHEIGHMLGLGHVGDKSNVMHIQGGTEFTDGQRETMMMGARNLKGCRP